MQQDNRWIRSQMADLLGEAFGPSTQASTPLAQMAARALVYGLSRMNSDGHFPEWNLVEKNPNESAQGIDHQTLDFFIALLKAQAASQVP